jgi:hypothetical protein
LDDDVSTLTVLQTEQMSPAESRPHIEHFLPSALEGALRKVLDTFIMEL